ncbi:hypothetical protein RD792_003805 [Penstemon davidsonii]|uniref:WRKY domain-containing protein n=1 Tax=Penstemon davidsonii TaxID=160366 RepID=A0ABR0DH40_9LAMI|nr:hypothetical protein RD792_003805 [Penstemon davidsonii]
MENYHGDLADIVVRATGSGTVGDGHDTAAVTEWQFPTNPINFSSSDPSEDFGHPFAHLRDPLLLDIDNTTTITTTTPAPAPAVSGFGTAGSLGLIDHKNIEADEMKHNIFSRMLQISPNAKLTAPCSPSSMLVPSSNHHHNHSLMISSNIISKVESTASLQISSPRNTGIKRRKSQANNKVVCIPAPAPANSRPSGEVVPSDLWAWRKYGQKPIKGSPYPRGYYRCSSSKGCSARKQVERSRTDPNMLVITYTSEHNHPWPTQRNALAGSTRTHQPTKNNTTKNSQPQKPKEEQKEITSTTDQNTNKAVKEEEMDQEFDHNHLDQMDDAEFDHKGLPQSYNSEDSFFADLGEIESTDPLELLFTQGFSGGGGGGGGDDRDDNKISLDPFSFYDWVGNTSSTSTIATTTTTTTTTSYGPEAKRDS